MNRSVGEEAIETNSTRMLIITRSKDATSVTAMAIAGTNTKLETTVGWKVPQQRTIKEAAIVMQTSTYGGSSLSLNSIQILSHDNLGCM